MITIYRRKTAISSHQAGNIWRRYCCVGLYQQKRPLVSVSATTSIRNDTRKLSNQRHSKMADTQPESAPVEEKKEEESLPPLSDHDFKIFNRMSEHMDLFHNHFRSSWTLLWDAANARRRPSNLTHRQFLDAGLSFCSSLNMHHGIEEARVFPLLARRMPEFRPGRAGPMVAQHRLIHAGLESFEAYLRAVRAGEQDLDWAELKARMESWGGVLWEHLDEEVKSLGADNMRKYWSKQEMMKMAL